MRPDDPVVPLLLGLSEFICVFSPDIPLLSPALSPLLIVLLIPLFVIFWITVYVLTVLIPDVGAVAVPVPLEENELN